MLVYGPGHKNYMKLQVRHGKRQTLVGDSLVRDDRRDCRSLAGFPLHSESGKSKSLSRKTGKSEISLNTGKTQGILFAPEGCKLPDSKIHNL